MGEMNIYSEINIETQMKIYVWTGNWTRDPCINIVTQGLYHWAIQTDIYSPSSPNYQSCINLQKKVDTAKQDLIQIQFEVITL